MARASARPLEKPGCVLERRKAGATMSWEQANQVGGHRRGDCVLVGAAGIVSWLGVGARLGVKVQLLHGAYVDERQTAALTKARQFQGKPDLDEELLDEVGDQELGVAGESQLPCGEDPLLPDAVALIAQVGTASTLLLQRRLRLEYIRAGRLIDVLERRGVIFGYEGSRPGPVLISEADMARVLAELGRDSGSGR